PEGVPGSEPTTDAHANDCPDLSVDKASGDHAAPAASISTQSGNSNSQPCVDSKSPEAVGPEKDPPKDSKQDKKEPTVNKTEQKEAQAKSEVAPAKPTSPEETQPAPAPISKLPETQ